MDSLIREANENLKAIIDAMKANLDNSINVLDNIQMQMDKKVEEAKKYKIEVDSAKDIIKEYEADNKSLESSLKELTDKFGKMNLVSLVEAGNKEIKAKINNNNREINKQKERIAELTNKARTIKDLLINLKKDRTIKEERLENLRTVYEYYSERIDDVIDYAFNHSNSLGDYKDSYSYGNIEEVVENSELENTMVFDEIADIDGNKVFKDEMTFIDSQIDDAVNDKGKIDEIINNSLSIEAEEVVDNYLDDTEEVKVIEDDIDTTQVFDSIFEEEVEEQAEESTELENEQVDEDVVQESVELEIEQADDLVDETEQAEEVVQEISELNDEQTDIIEDNLMFNEEPIVEQALVSDETQDAVLNNNDIEENEISITEEVEDDNKDKLDIFNIEDLKNEDIDLGYDGEDRISKINDLFSSIDNTNTSTIPVNSAPSLNIETQIDDAYKDIFGVSLEEDELNKKDSTLTDIFGNPIKQEELSEDVKNGKKIEELFVENGIDFNKFKEDEQNYLKQIYDEEKFINIFNTLNRNKINLDNLYSAFNVFGEITANELENLISKLINCGQSVEAIGLVLEKLPKVKKYNLDEAIISYGDYVKNIDITELIMKAKDLYSNGGNI